MNKKFVFTSKLSPYIEGLLREKEHKGLLKRNGFKWIMLEFDKFYVENNIQNVYIKQEIIAKWRNTRVNDSSRTIYNKLSAWRQLARYMCSIGIESYVVRLPKNGAKNLYKPYIFTHHEMDKIFSVSDQLRIRVRNAQVIMFVIPALIRLLYSTGIRIGEALEIRNKDIDFEKKCIRIKGAKNYTERLAAINDSLLLVLQQFKKFRDRIPIDNILLPDHYFFISHLGKKCNDETTRKWFYEILRFCGIGQQTGGNSPRLHDLRHTAAVHGLMKMIENNTDIYCALPVISNFLGHKKVSSTEVYVRLTKEAFPHIINPQMMVSSVFPKINLLNNRL
ncbi:tyrosine-type recombinase/integrase [Chryseobacterium sp. MEBOG07]|uniref:tyrosine-type recombinase/integrase n=1 Tax=Chryseobacterium sp. MEBOG07 TaxID=2879939 RepID=UPI001F01B26A|nr:tyrosine-type recombinase/integrase [Chryseobacterium sp. MEBOG07]UKB78346.1 tyrosine-type recombinase/integrase [Chryseobacterium sp. MEBOG07]